MTIHSDWSRILHEECPEAFTHATPRGQHKVGVIDGHLQLMRLNTGMCSWDAFVNFVFAKPIMQLFDAGCPTVVLCFDCYDSVPSYKSMTQQLRVSRQKQEVKIFEPHQELPSTIPDDAMTYLMNRHFKIKVIEMLCAKVPLAVTLKEGQKLVLDYRKVVVFEKNAKFPVSIDAPMVPMGESDVKFCRYVSLYGNALVHAIDGDYLVIALLYYARHGITPDNKIYIYRQLATLKPTKKRKAGEADVAKTKTDKKCWVNMQMLFAVIARAAWMSVSVRPINPITRRQYSDADAVVSIVYMMLLAGTDFSRNLPQIGPKRMWDALPLVMQSLLVAVNDPTRIDEDFFAQTVVGKLYSNVYDRHLKHSTEDDLTSVLSCLSTSKLSERTKARLPSVERVIATLRNLLWVVTYWSTENGVPETPLDGTYGFARHPETGDVCFSDAMSADVDDDDLVQD
jgi:hypothetical protein